MTAIELRIVVAKAATEAGWDVDPDCWSSRVGYFVRAELGEKCAEIAVPAVRLPGQTIWQWTKATGAAGAEQVAVLCRSPLQLVSPEDGCWSFRLRGGSHRERPVGPPSVDLGGGMDMDVSSLTKAILSNDLIYRRYLSVGGTQRVRLDVMQIQCPACRADNAKLVLDGHWTSRCGRVIKSAALFDVELTPELVESVTGHFALDPYGPAIWSRGCDRCGVELFRFAGGAVPSQRHVDLGAIDLEEGAIRSGLRHPFGAEHWCSRSSPCPGLPEPA